MYDSGAHDGSPGVFPTGGGGGGGGKSTGALGFREPSFTFKISSGLNTACCFTAGFTLGSCLVFTGTVVFSRGKGISTHATFPSTIVLCAMYNNCISTVLESTFKLRYI